MNVETWVHIGGANRVQYEYMKTFKVDLSTFWVQSGRETSTKFTHLRPKGIYLEIAPEMDPLAL